MTTCFCGRELQNGDRQFAMALRVDWGDNDEREDTSKQAVFHSFKCAADYLTQLAANHDDRIVTSGNPDEPPPSDEPIVDTRTESLIRKD